MHRVMRNNLHNLGKTIRALRRQRGLTQEQLAERADLHSTYIAKIEAGQRLPSLDTLVLLADALETPVSVIIQQAEHRQAEHQGKPDVFRDAGTSAGSEDIQQVKREISYMLEDMELEQSLLLRDIIRAIKKYRTD